MKKINWKVRFMSPAFWMALIPAVLLLIQAILALFGVTWDVEPLNSQLIGIVDAVFVVLMVLGIVIDPTTKGLSDSNRALGYTEPNDDRQKFAHIEGKD